jgi:hypothetical protein
MVKDHGSSACGRSLVVAPRRGTRVHQLETSS